MWWVDGVKSFYSKIQPDPKRIDPDGLAYISMELDHFCWITMDPKRIDPDGLAYI